MKLLRVVAAPVVFVLALLVWPCRPTAAETVVEAWRSPFGTARSVAVNPTDGSCWAATGGSVMHLAADGTILSQANGFGAAWSVSVNSVDATCWVADSGGNQVVHLGANEAQVWRGGGFNWPRSVSVNPTDGSCWVADTGHNEVVHVSAAGAELWRVGGFSSPGSVSVNPTDGSCWVADSGNNEVVHLSAGGEELLRAGGFNHPMSVSVNPADASCWVADWGNNQVVHLAANGAELWCGGAFGDCESVSVNRTDGSCWVAEGLTGEVVHLSAAGEELWRGGALSWAYSVSVDPTDGSCWVATWEHSEVVHLSAAGEELWRGGGFYAPESVSVNPAEGSCWVADTWNSQVVHLSEAGAEVWRGGGFYLPRSVSVNLSDGSCWVADSGHNQVVHLGADGAELWRGGGFNGPYSVSVNSSDGSCWVADAGNNQVVHLGANGAELWRGGGFNGPYSVSVNSSDGSCWVADAYNGQVVHLGANGAELWRGGGFQDPVSVSANPTDGSCWVADSWNNQVVHLAASGDELWRGAEFGEVRAVSVNPMDGSCWVADLGSNQLVHLALDGTELWRGGAFDAPSRVSVDWVSGSSWAIDGGNCQVVRTALPGYRVPQRFMTHATFDSPSPWAAFSSGPGSAYTWRRALTATPAAHSGLYAMCSAVDGQAIAGLRLALPTEPSGPVEVVVRAWVYVAERTESDSSTVFGFTFTDEYPSSAAGWSQDLGWEVLSDTTSQYQLAGSPEAESRGIASGGWHLVQLRYVRATNKFTLWLDGVLVAERNAPGAARRAPTYVILGALGQSSSARQDVYFDDVQVTLVGYEPTQSRPFALLDGNEQVAEGQTQTYALQYGDGYPMLGLDEVSETLPDRIRIAASLPGGYSFLSADPEPSRVAGGTPVWDLPMPAMGQAGFIHLTVATPTGLAAPITDRIWAWATTSPSAATSDPPNPPDWTNPIDPVWGAPQDALPQQIEVEPRPDLWVHKIGPRFASPGDKITYAITVGNCGSGPASAITARDRLPDLLGNGDHIVGNIRELKPAETWTSAISATLPWGVPGGTLLLNQAYVPTAAGEVVVGNNQCEWQTTVQAARDPNQVSVSPEGGADRGQILTYTLHCENTGLGTAYGVYATATLDGKLDGATLLLSDPDHVSYDPASRTLVWDVGTLGPGEGASVWFTVNVASDARRARPLIGQAVVYFPSVPEETPTNVVLNVVNGSFPDVPWDHWAVLPIELCCENGIVTGYGDGTYRPDVEVKRDQMAVYIARSLAGGDAKVPDGPPTPRFSDVDTGYWAYKYIEYCVANYIVVGYAVDNTYRPGEKVNRGQMAAYVARAIYSPRGIPPDDLPAYVPPLTPSFSDVATDYPFYKHIEYVVAAGVVQGYGDGTYRTGTIVNRGQMAVYVQRAFQLPM